MTSKQPVNKKNIVITLNSPFTKDIYLRIGIEKLKSFYHITLLDCLDYLNQDFNSKSSYKKYIDPDIDVIPIKNLLQCKALLLEKKPIFLLDCIGKSDVTPLFQALCLNQQITYVYDGLVNTLSGSSKDLFIGMLSMLPEFISKTVATLTCKLLYIDYIRPDTVLTGSSFGTLWERSAKNRIFSAGQSFFEVNKSIKNYAEYPRIVDGDFILFLDDCLIDSFDFSLGHQKSSLGSKDYFNLMSLFFEKLEKQFKLPVVIAAHPNGMEHKNYEEKFGNRKVIFNKTSLLSRDCSLAITHYSLSVHYPILFLKPILFLNLDSLPHHVKKVQNAYSQALNASCVNVTRGTINKALNDFYIDQKKYNKFTRKYIHASAKVLTDPYDPLIKYFK